MIWKDIPSYEGRYQISPEGDIRAIWAKSGPKPKKIMFIKPKSGSGSPRNEVELTDANGRRKRHKVANLVYRTFVGEKPRGACLVHKNGDLTDDNVNNLIIASQSDIGRLYGYRQNSRRPVARCNSKGEVLEIYPSVRKCAAAVGMAHASIRSFCNGDLGPMARDGYIYKWDDEIEY